MPGTGDSRKQVVITGASGNIGTALLRRCQDLENWDITGVARRLPDRDRTPYSCATWFTCDIGEPSAPASLAEIFTGADAVVHLAWAIHPPRSDPPMRRTNNDGTAAVLAAAAAAGVRHIVCASSVAAYSPAQRWQRVHEDWPCDGVPGSAYSRGKAELERRLDAFTATRPDITLTRIRPCAVVQRDAAGEFARWLTSALLPERLIGARWLPLPLWDELRLQLVHAEDVADAIRLILNRGESGAFNLAAEPALGAVDVTRAADSPRLPVPAGLVKAAAGLTWQVGVQPLHPGWLTLADQVAHVDTTRAREQLGWAPRWDGVSALKDLLEGMRDLAGAPSPPLEPNGKNGLLARLRSVPWGRPGSQPQA
ncbi:Nucleoside-diphosphate-sugar epimerase [Amycolatopsis marina]|uniref:Nucleoside-diphosphate-sugar epimerase n=1 Tax=Amycolatopsis marina TaxID=490629 RepID=A0A1I0XHV3_9PSEU|nr:NAD-dependent epimerase/dehydratase family protein [Amycolatopsis marina]SFB00592.1 Nucleoside-diphosphate-sugar epimerase [Amycolatopsis marina]